jgi:hypothetical protein
VIKKGLIRLDLAMNDSTEIRGVGLGIRPHKLLAQGGILYRPQRGGRGALLTVGVGDHRTRSLLRGVEMEDVSILSMDMDGLIERGGRISVMVMLVFLGLFCVILWLSIRASQRYRKDTYDSEIQKLKSEIEHLKTINRKLMQRNLDLSKKESASHFLG